MRKLILILMFFCQASLAESFYIKVVSDGENDKELSAFCERFGYKDTVTVGGEEMPNIVSKVYFASQIIRDAILNEQSLIRVAEPDISSVSRQSVLIKIEGVKE